MIVSVCGRLCWKSGLLVGALRAVFGWDGVVEGFFWCAGQGGFGIQTAPAAGDVCAALLLGEKPEVAAEAYLATRAGI